MEVIRSQRVGYGTIATPGGFAGLALASRQFGRLPWSRLLEPAIDWVERGFPAHRWRRGVPGLYPCCNLLLAPGQLPYIAPPRMAPR